MDTFKVKWTRLQSEIFRLLCVKAGEVLNLRGTARLLSVTPTAVSNALSELEQEKLIKVTKSNVMNLLSIELNRENKRTIELKRAENLRMLYESGLTDYFEKELAGGTIILFGSYSKGEDTNTSDIDIAVIGRKDKLLKLEEYENKLEHKINVNFYNNWKGINEQLRNNILNGILLQGSVEL